MSRTALITGCSSGIGRASAKLFAERGWRVIATMRNPASGDELRAAGCEVTALDVTDLARVSQVAGDLGAVDVLVNNAGLGFTGAIETMTDDVTRAVFDTNVHGVLALTRAVLPAMRERGTGVIVNVSSVNGHIALPCGGVYAASKFALDAISEALALEVAPFGVRVVVIEPGFIRTAIAENGRAGSHLDPASPYAALESGMADYLANGVATGEPAEAVAQAILDAAEQADTPLRVPVGAGAADLIAARRASTDDEWLAGMRATYGLADLPTPGLTALAALTPDQAN